MPAPPSTTTQLDLDAANASLQGSDAQHIIRWARDTFADRLVLTSSFGAQSALMLHLVTREIPDIPVILIDTGYLFPETYRFALQLKDRLNLNLKIYQPQLTTGYLEAVHGKLWEQGPDGLAQYHQLVKIEPMQRALRDLNASAWLAGLRAEQTNHRANLRHLELQDNLYKVHPVLHWSTRDVHQYLKQHDLPYHPLYEQGYHSIGDTHSTRPITADENERDGRFSGLRQECGLHLPASKEESQSRDSSGL